MKYTFYGKHLRLLKFIDSIITCSVINVDKFLYFLLILVPRVKNRKR